MEVVTTRVKDWSENKDGFVTGEGLQIDKDQSQKLLSYYQIPGTLLNVDKNFKTDTALQVLKSVPNASVVNLLVDTDAQRLLSVQDPRSNFFNDEEFGNYISDLEGKGMQFKKDSHPNGSFTAIIELPVKDSDNFVGDLFQKKVILERLPEGGMHVAFGLLRQACTNGMLTRDKEFNMLSRKKLAAETVVASIADSVLSLNLNEYFENLWKKDGEFFQASVEDFYQMKRCLASKTSENIASVYYQVEPIEQHYASQGIELKNINGKLRSRMPAGLSYYNCFQILTNAAKNIENPTLEDKIDIAKFAAPSKIKQLKDSDIKFQGQPKFEEHLVEELMGDAEWSNQLKLQLTNAGA